MRKIMEFFPDYRPAGFLGIATGGQGGNSEEMDYILGVTNHVDVSDCNYVPNPKEMTEYAVYKQFYSEWFPSSGYKLADLPVIECYMQENRQEVWIAMEGVNKAL